MNADRNLWTASWTSIEYRSEIHERTPKVTNKGVNLSVNMHTVLLSAFACKVPWPFSYLWTLIKFMNSALHFDWKVCTRHCITTWVAVRAPLQPFTDPSTHTKPTNSCVIVIGELALCYRYLVTELTFLNFHRRFRIHERPSKFMNGVAVFTGTHACLLFAAYGVVYKFPLSFQYSWEFIQFYR